jgi:hypothetical protein
MADFQSLIAAGADLPQQRNSYCDKDFWAMPQGEASEK